MTGNGPATVLVVDDNAATRYATGRVLRSVGHAVLTAASGTEAIAVALQSRPDVIVLDINLPDIDGFQVCRDLRWSTCQPLSWTTSTRCRGPTPGLTAT
jgi:CheY-like chemotaxis protein